MTLHNIVVVLQVEGETREDAVATAQSAIEYMLEVSNDDGLINSADVEQADIVGNLENVARYAAELAEGSCPPSPADFEFVLELMTGAPYHSPFDPNP